MSLLIWVLSIDKGRDKDKGRFVVFVVKSQNVKLCDVLMRVRGKSVVFCKAPLARLAHPPISDMWTNLYPLNHQGVYYGRLPTAKCVYEYFSVCVCRIYSAYATWRIREIDRVHDKCINKCAKASGCVCVCVWLLRLCMCV